jgi:hippurate hydrolase
LPSANERKRQFRSLIIAARLPAVKQTAVPTGDLLDVATTLAVRAEEMTAWRRHLHAQPEIAFEERRTAQFVAERLEEFGLAVTRGLAGTGVVATLHGDEPAGRAIALRADLDALALNEENTFPHRSREAGRMHACGHDGHVAMLLGAARHLAQAPRFRGTVHFVFQPAEENEGGGRAMVDDGLFDRFPVEAVFGLHNWPGLPAGTFAVHDDAVMAAFDTFEVTVRGRGSHGAMPHLGVDPVVTAAQMVLAFQTIVSRSVSPLDAAVVSVTDVRGGETWNVIPAEVRLRGTTRSFRPDVRDALEAGVGRVAEGVAAAAGASAEVRYERRYPATVNTKPEAEAAARAAASIVGADRVLRNLPPSMAAEDFAFLLQARPGCYAWIGNGPAGSGGGLHGPRYDFNDEILLLGASYWVRLVEDRLAAAPADARRVTRTRAAARRPSSRRRR